MQIVTTDFGTLSTGERAHLYTLSNEQGMTVSVTDLGGAIVHICAPDRNGVIEDVVLGYDKVETYEAADGYLGALVGRVAGRIPRGRFVVDGRVYNLATNDGPNHLHGGLRGFSHAMWKGTTAADEHTATLTLTLHSPDGEDGYPGNVDTTVTYTLTADNALTIHYRATTDRACPIDLTNHVYFNLSGQPGQDVLAEELWIDADRYQVSDHELIPTGEIRSVQGTPFDFRVAKPIGQDIEQENTDLSNAGGYDHCMVFTDRDERMPCRVRAYDPTSGRALELYTDQPCMNFYSANFLKNPAFPLRGGVAQRIRLGYCLETQKLIAGVHHPDGKGYCDCTLRPEDVYEHTVTFRFSVR